MKKVLLSFLVLISFALKMDAQDKKGYIGVSLGPSIAIGDFASKDADNEAAGWANTGAIFDISFAYKLGNGNFGLTALLRGQANTTDAQALVDEFKYQYPDFIWLVESGNWSIGGLMLGGFGSFPISDKTSFDARAMIGFLNASSPEIKITGIDSSFSSAWIKQSSSSASAFSYLIGAGFSFGIGNRLCILTNVDYLGAKPEFSKVRTTTSTGEQFTDTWSQNFGTLNIGIGIGIKI
jgi:opacity protein-like surface antigen